MEKLKGLFKNKKFIIALGAILILVALLVGVIIALNTNKDEKVLKTETHTMYVKINPLVKLTFEVSYYECLNEKGEKTICGDSTQLVTDYELINDDAKEFYKEMDFKGKDVMKVVVALCDTARDNNVGFTSLEITSDYKFDKEKISEAIKNGSKYDTVYNVFVDFEESINEQEILDKADDGPIVTYTVKFDTNGGSSIDDVVVRENDLVLAPVIPTKKGYEFVSWQLDGKDYDFKTAITKDITLKAKWKKASTGETVAEETKKIELSYYCKAVNFANVGNGLLAKCAEKYQQYTVTMTVAKSLADKHKNKNELLNYLTITADMNGKKIGNYDVNVKVTSSNSGITAEVKDKVKIEVHKAPESTLSKINLNENIMVEVGDGFSSCGDSTIIFSSNIEEVYPDMVKKDGKGNKAIYLVRDEYQKYLVDSGMSESEYKQYNLESKFMERFNQINWNTTKETEVNNILKEMEKQKVPGIAGFYGGLENHMGFYYDYNYINIYDDDLFSKLDSELSTASTNFWSKLNKAVEGRINLIYYDACGSGPSEKLLDEEMCKEYNLNCSRW